MRGVNNKNSLWKIFVRFMKLLDRRIYIYSLAILFMTISMSMFTVISSYLFKDILDLAQRGTDDGLGRLITVNVGAGFIVLLIWWASTVIYNIEAKRGTAQIEKIVFSKAMRLPMSYYENHHSGDFISKLIYDTNTATDIYRSRLRRLIAPILSVIVYLVPMFILSWQITSCLLAVNVISLVLNSRFVKPMKKIGSEMSKKNATMTERLTNLLHGIEMTKVFPAGSVIVGKFHTANRECATAFKRKSRISACLESINTAFDLICSLAFLGIGIYFVQNGSASIGALTAVYAMYGAFSWQFLQIGRYIPEIVNCISHAKRIFEFLDEEEEPESYNIEGVEATGDAGDAGDAGGTNVSTGADADGSGVARGEDNATGEDADGSGVAGIEYNSAGADADGSGVARGEDNATGEDADGSGVAGIEYNATGADAEAGFIEMKDVSFGYSEDRRILDKFSLSVKKGTSVAITGPSGRGKSTLAKILLGFYEPESGCISIGGVPLKEIKLKKLREMIAYVPQEPYIYNVSIRENIAYGLAGCAGVTADFAGAGAGVGEAVSGAGSGAGAGVEEAGLGAGSGAGAGVVEVTDEQVEMAARAANAHDFIMKLEDGYDTVPGERGGRLSGGERQRIAIARAVLKNAPILLLDEATSALDNESERLVQEALDNLMKDRTTIMIAHRPSTIASADFQVEM